MTTTENTRLPFHKGELQVQKQVGSYESLAYWGEKAIRPYFPEQHRTFFSQLPFLVISACDESGLPWVTLLTGRQHFISSPDDRHLHFALNDLNEKKAETRHVAIGDALDNALTVGTDIGLVGIELHSRRRNRASGFLSKADANGLTFEVVQSYGNCPQYISERDWYAVDIDEKATQVTRHKQLTSAMQSWIANADTLFIGSGYRAENEHESNGMDASHRGGAKGFVSVINERQLVIPDYAGNNFFNTIGNLIVNPLVGLLFIDFEEGNLLQLSGRATIDWDSEEVNKYAGAHRLLNIEIDHVVEQKGVLPIRWQLPDGIKGGLTLTKKTKESVDVTSFEFVAKSKEALPTFRAGQHLPIQVAVGDKNNVIQNMERTYSLSNSSHDQHYRISVKREPHGIVSNFLHDKLSVGDTLQAKKPNGDFLLKFPSRPVVLISAGVGITPIISMLYSLVDMPTTVHVIYGARNQQQAPLLNEVRALSERHRHIDLTVSFSQPTSMEALGVDYDNHGHIDGAVIKNAISDLSADFYLCGPMAFLDSLLTELKQLGVKREHIYFESF